MDATKIGARNSRSDQERLQMMHDFSVENGAICKEGKAISLDDILVFDGSEVKALEGGKVAGYLVRFSTKSDPDLTGDYFSPDTDYGTATKTAILYQHGFDKKMKRRKLGEGELRKDDIGVWVEAQLNLRDEYEKAIYDLAAAGKLGWSSGTASHLVERDGDGKITAWPLGLDASLTPTPAEPRNSAIPLKSLITSSEAAESDKSEEPTPTQAPAQSGKENEMEKDEFKAMLDESTKTIAADVEAKAEAAAKKAVDDVLSKLPEVKAAMNGRVEVTVDEADRPFKNLGENLIAIATYARTGKIAPRIKGLQAMELKAALGSNEAVPSQGEFLLEPTIGAELLKPMHEVGAFSADVRKLPVGPNSNSGWIPGIDETSRAAGSRWGGVLGYHLAEAASKTASQPKFRKINWELHKIAVLQYATDELLQDAGMLTAIINQSSAEELDFMVNDDILNGIGGDRPVGVLNSGALIGVGRTTATSVVHRDLVRMWQRLSPRSQARAKWYINSEVHPQLDQLTFTAGTTGILSPYVRYNEDGVMQIYGRPVVETEFNAALGTAGDILLADMGEYLFWEKGPAESASSIHVQFLTDQTVFRFVYRCDGQTALASALTPYKGSNTQSPFVSLLSTTA